jgi:hypothetical protein
MSIQTSKTLLVNISFSLDVTNTFAATNSMVLQILWIGTVGASDSTIELISALEDNCQVSQQTGHLT